MKRLPVPPPPTIDLGERDDLEGAIEDVLAQPWIEGIRQEPVLPCPHIDGRCVFARTG